MSQLRSFLPAFVSCLLLGSLCHAETVTVLTGNIEPYAIEKGPRQGAGIDMIREMGKRAGLDVDIVFKPWQRALAEAAQGPNVAIFPLTRTQEREAKYRWVVGMIPGEPFALLAIRPDVDISSFDAVRDKLVGGMRNAPAEGILRHNGLTNLDLDTDNPASLKKLLRGRTDAWLARVSEAKSMMAEMGEDPARLRIGVSAPSPDSFLAASLDFPQTIAQKLAKAFDSIKADGTYDKIIDSYKK
jgi:polar amino acid transport system substrate-binding protein